MFEATEAETDQEFVFQVRVKGFGKREKLGPDLMLRLARAIHHGATKEFVVRADAGGWWRFDPLGDDMGNHEGHKSGLVPAVRFVCLDHLAKEDRPVKVPLDAVKGSRCHVCEKDAVEVVEER